MKPALKVMVMEYRQDCSRDRVASSVVEYMRSNLQGIYIVQGRDHHCHLPCLPPLPPPTTDKQGDQKAECIIWRVFERYLEICEESEGQAVPRLVGPQGKRIMQSVATMAGVR